MMARERVTLCPRTLIKVKRVTSPRVEPLPLSDSGLCVVGGHLGQAASEGTTATQLALGARPAKSVQWGWITLDVIAATLPLSGM